MWTSKSSTLTLYENHETITSTVSKNKFFICHIFNILPSFFQYVIVLTYYIPTLYIHTYKENKTEKDITS